jgi:hypothetical protein
MSFCVNCGVALEDDMKQCPLCGTPAGAFQVRNPATQRLRDVNLITETIRPENRSLLQRILWQVTSILLLSGIISTLIIDLTINKTITWSVYPVTVCIIIFSYASLFAFWNARRVFQIIAGLLISSAMFVALELLLPQSNWPLQLGLPLLCAVNFVAIVLIISIDRTKHKGLNVVAYSCVAIAVLCISIEFVVSFYNGNMLLRWSVIVAACMLPVTAALIFMHYRIKKNPDMERIFHT